MEQRTTQTQGMSVYLEFFRVTQHLVDLEHTSGIPGFNYLAGKNIYKKNIHKYKCKKKLCNKNILRYKKNIQSIVTQQTSDRTSRTSCSTM